MGYKKQKYLKKVNSKKNKSKPIKKFKKEILEDELFRNKVNKRELLETVKLAEIEEMEAEYV
ncbi:MAG: hypothetical protein DWP97_14095 [Calditrichaeota bacterium]|nr:MAG: hypothetical protein DWP97_14095 [Calditrichota bacterium]